jgi:Ca2+-binding EF-hand superfamily protein
MHQSRKVTQQEIDQFINSVDVNKDNKINKEELLTIFKKVVNQSK